MTPDDLYRELRKMFPKLVFVSVVEPRIPAGPVYAIVMLRKFTGDSCEQILERVRNRIDMKGEPNRW